MQQLQSYGPNTANQHTTSQGPAPMDIGAAYNSSWHKGKGKGKKGHQKGKGKHQGKGYNSSYNNKGKEKEDIILSVKGIHVNKEIHSKEHQPQTT